MDALTSITAANAATAPDVGQPATAGNSKLGKNEFLKIFMAQLGQQDPTQPLDSRDFVAQLAQFASLEQAQNTNDTLQSLLMSQASLQQTSVTSLIGKQVEFKAGTVALTDPQRTTTISATLDADATSVTAVLTDANGKKVRTVQVGGHAAGSFDVAWDGRDDAGKPVPSGSYKVDLTAADRNGKAVTIAQHTTAQVTGVSFAGGVPTLLAGSQPIKMSDVVQINERSTP